MRIISTFHLLLKYSIIVLSLYEIKTIELLWTEEHGSNVQLKRAIHKWNSLEYRRGFDHRHKNRKQGFLRLFPQVKTSSKQKLHRRDLMEDLARIQERLATITAEPIKRIPSSVRHEETEHNTRATKEHTAIENQISFISSLRQSTESSTQSPDSPDGTDGTDSTGSTASTENVVPAILHEALSKEDGDRARAVQKGNANRKNDDQRLEKDRSSYGKSLGHVAGQSALHGQEHDLGGKKNCSEPCPKSIDEVYALSVRGERRYDAAAAGGCGGRVTVAELTAELLSEVQRVEQRGGAQEEGEPLLLPPPAAGSQPTRRDTLSTAGGPAPAWATRDSTTAAAAARKSSPKRSVAAAGADDAADNLADEDEDNVLPLVVNRRPMFGRPSLH